LLTARRGPQNAPIDTAWETRMADITPTLYDWLGGGEALNRLTSRFYEHVRRDPLLAPVFAHMGSEHPAYVANFLGEVLGGPSRYSESRGGHPHMVRAHLDRHLTQEMRRRWVALLLATADELGMPDDPEFRSALVGYLEWGSRLAVINSRPGAQVDPGAEMPRWGWGEVKGPYRGP
jgi:hemoglobin